MYNLKLIEEIIKLKQFKLDELNCSFDVKEIKKLKNNGILNFKKDKYKLVSEIKIGTIKISQKGTVSIMGNTIEPGDYLDKDEVYYSEIHKDILVLSLIKRNTNYLVATVSKKNKLVFDFPYYNNYFYKCLDDINFKKDFKIGFTIKKYGRINDINNPMFIKVNKIIGHKNDPKTDVLSILLEKGINPSFSEEVVKEAESFGDKITKKDYKGRVVIDEYVVTIDGDDSKDFDDAISIKKIDDKYLLKVHISDVSYYVKENSILDIEARSKTTSTYVLDSVVNMLPQSLSNGICSLNEGVKRLTITCEMLIDKNGEIKDYAIYPSIIKSNKRLTYNYVNMVLNDEIKSKNKNLLKLMHECSKCIRNKREKEGAIEFERDEISVRCDSDGKPLEIIVKHRFESEKIIEDFMILANICVGKHMKKLKIPCIYRIHEKPDALKLNEFIKTASSLKLPFIVKDVKPKDYQNYLNKIKGNDLYDIVSSMALRSMSKAQYDFRPLGHFGLALKDYLHFTSPIRRYPDLIVHRMLRKYYFEKNIDNKDNDIILVDKIALESSLLERNSIEAERLVIDTKIAELMSKYVGKYFNGIIISVVKFGFFVQLENQAEGLVHISSLNGYYEYNQFDKKLYSNNNTYSLGQKVIVKVIGADKDTRMIDLKLKNKKSKRSRWI